MVRKFPQFRFERKKRSTSEGTPQFPNGISEKLPYHLTSNRNFRPNPGKHPPSYFFGTKNIKNKNRMIFIGCVNEKMRQSQAGVQLIISVSLKLGTNVGFGE